MKENAYSELMGLMKDANPQQNNILIGEVISEDPLMIVTGDLTLNEDDMLIADYLKKEHEREVTVYGRDTKLKSDSITGQTTTSSNHTHGYRDIDIKGAEVEIKADDIDEGFRIETEDTLEVEDQVLMVRTMSKQLYIILARIEEV